MTDRVVLITGGAGHIGSAIGDALAEAGASIAIVDMVEDRASETARRIADAYNVPTDSFVVDLESETAVCGLPNQLRDRFGRLDVIVNCAAFVGTSGLEGWAVPFAEQSMDTWRRALEVNLTAPFALIQAAADDLRASGHGSVINIASIYGLVGPNWSLYEGTNLGNPAAYAASKGGMVQMTRWLATTVAPEIRVNTIAPGGLFRNTPEPFLERYEAQTPMARMGTEEDLK
ncbi:MAG: SDR family NAD(P)-dependent oxidoreductase, partial [Fimbriimonadaceae bacterium]|nr:SDR family NAD(P)-dependent oxidoreductase [Alphaproteobacteria bacterium]